jgi:short-subunit dehydrogenase
VLSFSQALHAELKPRGVTVTAQCPGPVPTEFQARAGVSGRRDLAWLTVPADRVAREGFDGLMQGRRLVLPGLGAKMVSRLPRILPVGVLLRVTAGRERKRAATSASKA